MPTIVITGLPGSGKTTLGHQLANKLDQQLLDKDNFLEDLFRAQGPPDPTIRSQLSRRADVAFIKQAQATDTPILVSFWRRTELSTTAGTPIDWLDALNEVVEVFCECSPEVALSRFRARRRHPGHGDSSKDHDELIHWFTSLHNLGPLGVGRLVRVNTEAQVDVDSLADAIATKNQT